MNRRASCIDSERFAVVASLAIPNFFLLRVHPILIRHAASTDALRCFLFAHV